MRYQFYRLAALWLTMVGVAMLTGCAMTPTASPTTKQVENASIAVPVAAAGAIQSFSLQGRLSANTQKQGFSGGISWQHHPDTDNIELFSPLGGKVADISRNNEGVHLTDNQGKQLSAQDAESLTEQTMGWRLPLTGLSNWVKGTPHNGSSPNAQWDDQGRITHLKQDDWDIEYLNYQQIDGYDLPGKIFMRSEKAYLKLVIEKWSLPETRAQHPQ